MKFDKLIEQKMKLYEAALQSAPNASKPQTTSTTQTAPVAGTQATAQPTQQPVAKPTDVQVTAQNLPDILSKIQKDPNLQKALQDYITKNQPQQQVQTNTQQPMQQQVTTKV
jgi:hypothetical protein